MERKKRLGNLEVILWLLQLQAAKNQRRSRNRDSTFCSKYVLSLTQVLRASLN